MATTKASGESAATKTKKTATKKAPAKKTTTAAKKTTTTKKAATKKTITTVPTFVKTTAKKTTTAAEPKKVPPVIKPTSGIIKPTAASLVGAKPATNPVSQAAQSLPQPTPVSQLQSAPEQQSLPQPRYNNRNNNGNRNNNRSSNRNGNNNQRGNWRNNRGGRRYNNNTNSNNQNQNFGGVVEGRTIPDAGMPTEVISGILDMKPDGNGIIRENYTNGDRDAYISGSQLRRFRIRPGDKITGPARMPKDNEQFWGLLKVDLVNDQPPEKMMQRVKFRNLTPVYPDNKIVLETEPEILTTRLIDLIAPVGRGQRGMIVSPPKAGKTTMLKDISTGIAKNLKDDMHMMAVLIGERPEEVTDIRRHIEKITDGKGEVAASNFDEQAQEQVRVSELALEKAKRMVEMGRHVVVLLDSITRLARAYNLAIPTSGRTLSGGFDPAALYPPKKFFGAARNFEEFETVDGKKTGSLTILGTALVDTGSRMDELIYEEFKGTGNMELHLDRNLAERRIYPAIDVNRSGTRREDLLFDNVEYQSIIVMRRMLDMLDQKERTSVLVGRMKGTKSNKEFLATLKNG